jgi:serine/threonine-protein kinase
MNEIVRSIDEGYEIIREIGRGSVGVVYACRPSMGSNSDVAIKIMSPSPMLDTAVFDGIINAAMGTRSLPDNAAVVRVLSAGKTPSGHYYITMELVEGGTLERFIGEENLDFQGKLRLAAGIAKALGHIHSAGITHGDLKPPNILISPDGKPLLNDFYLVPRLEAAATGASSMGTPYYMSPEQAEGRPVSPASDIYSFGVLLYELLTGKTPYSAETNNLSEMIEAVSKGKIESLGKHCRKASPKLDALMSRLLSKEPETRPRHGAEVATTLLEISEETNPPSVLEKLRGLFARRKI